MKLLLGLIMVLCGFSAFSETIKDTRCSQIENSVPAIDHATNRFIGCRLTKVPLGTPYADLGLNVGDIVVVNTELVTRTISSTGK